MKSKHLRKALEGLAERRRYAAVHAGDRLGHDRGRRWSAADRGDGRAHRDREQPRSAVRAEPRGPLRAGSRSEDRAKLDAFLETNRSTVAKDLDGAPVYLAKNAWDVGYVSEKNPAIRFTKTKERV